MRGCLATGCACLPVADAIIAGLLEPFVDRLLHDFIPARDAMRAGVLNRITADLTHGRISLQT